MKYIFAIAFAVLVLLSGVAWLIQPRLTEEGKTPLVWVSDDNPARREQIELFNLLIRPCDVPDWAALCQKLYGGAVAPKPCPSRQLWGLLPPDARAIIRDAAQGRPLDAERQRQALQVLNDVLARRDFYWEPDFPGVTLEPDEVKTLMDEGEDPSELEVRAINVRLLEHSYPGLVARKLHLRLDPSNVGMQKVIVQCIGGVGPDLFDCYDGFQLSAYVRSGIAMDATDALAAAGINVAKDCWAAAHPNCIYEGRTYGFPTNASVNAIWINKEIFDRHGIAYPKGPWTWDEFIPLAQRLTVKGASGRMEHFGLMMDWWNWRHFCLQWGGRVYTEDGTRCVLDSPGNIAAIQLMQDLVYKHHVAPSPVEEAAIATAGGWGSGTISFFGGGKAAMALGGRWWLCTLRKYEGLRLGAVECPHGPLRTFRGYGRATLVNKNSPRREQALAFLRYMAAKEYNELINHQADALAPVIRHCYTDLYLHDPKFPNEDSNAVWRDIMQYGTPDEVSPFVNGNVAGRIIGKQLDLVKNGAKPAADAMRTAARQINEEIQKMLDRDPELRQRYEELTKR
ncbi:MAG TPA: extracellular solute-binding protein [Planctomycetota bacterium]|nr:extracellular solute-binding protein [Planctomycetota bacterium]